MLTYAALIIAILCDHSDADSALLALSEDYSVTARRVTR